MTYYIYIQEHIEDQEIDNERLVITPINPIYEIGYAERWNDSHKSHKFYVSFSNHPLLDNILKNRVNIMIVDVNFRVDRKFIYHGCRVRIVGNSTDNSRVLLIYKGETE